LHVAFVLDSLGSGGAQRQVVEIAARLQQRDDTRCSLVVYHPDDFFEGRLRASGVALVRLRKRLPADPLVAFGIRRWLARARPDLVHAFLWYPTFWSLLAVRSLAPARRPVLVTAERSSLFARGLPARIQRLTYRASDAVTVNSQPMLEAIRERVGVPGERLHYLPNGIDLERWDADARAPCPLALEPGRLHLGLIGGLRGAEKGHLVLLRALGRLGRERIRDWRVWFVGARIYGAAAAAEIEAAIREQGLGDVVRIVDPVRNMAALMRGLDAVVLPSLFEGFPNVVLEAMASRLPLVVTPVGEVPSLVDEGVNGFFAETGDDVTLAAALERLAALPAERRRAMGEQGRARVEARYGMDAVAEAHRALYARLVARRARFAGP
jgi:glycosyltransferase involved in cell wall biosynthesis